MLSPPVGLNFILVLAIAIYGLFADEPSWREDGHSPWLYDYLYWLAVALNGPSGFIPDYARRVITGTSSLEKMFVAQYGLWLLLLWPQWRIYDLVARWCIADRRREIALYVATAGISVIGAVVTYEAWILERREAEYIPLSFDWVAGHAGLALVGLIILA
jgi:4-hydroxybenzoate polyprenyltransferase